MARKIEVQITGNSSSFERALSRSGNSASSWGSKVGKGIGIAAAAAGAALIGLGGFAVKSAIDFESSFAGVRKTVNATEKEFAAMEKGLLDMSRKIPVNVNELNNIAEAAGQLGVSKKNILEFTSVIAKLGVSSNLAGEEGAAMLARFANITKIPQDQYDNLGSAIVALGNAGASTEAEIASMAMRIGAAGTQVGLTAPQILGLANALSSVGIEAEAGGTAMSNALFKINNAVDEGGSKLEGFAKVSGVSAEQFAAQWKANPSQALLGFFEGLNKVQQGGGNVNKTLTSLGLTGIRLQDALGRAANAHELFRKSLDLGEKSWAANVALNKEAAERFKTTASQLQLLKNNLSAVAIVAGSELLPAFNKALLAVVDFGSKFFEAKGFRAKLNVIWEGAQEAGQALTAKVGEAVAAIDWAAVWATAEGIGEGLAAKLESTDWSAVGAAIGAGIAVGVQRGGQIAKRLGTIVNEGIQAIDWNALGRAAGPGLAAAMVTAFATIMDVGWWTKNWDLALAVGLAVFGKGIGKLAAPIGTALKGMLGKVWDDAVVAISGSVERWFPRIASGILSVLNKLPGVITGALSKVVSTVGSTFAKLGSIATFAAKVTGISAVISAVTGMAKAVYGKLQDIVGWFRALPSWLTAAFPNPAGLLVGIGVAIIGGLWEGLKSKASEMLGWVSGLGGKIKSLKGPESKDRTLLTEEGKAIILGLEDGMNYSWAQLAPKINALGGNIVKNFILGIGAAQPQFTGKMSEAAQAALEAGRATVERYQGRLGEAFGKLGEFASRAFEAKTQQMLDKVAAKFDRQISKWQGIAAAATPAERELARIDEEESRRSRDAASQAAQDALTTAEAMEAGVERERAIAAAKEQIRQAELGQRRAVLQATAEQERVAQEAAAAVQIAKLEEMKARELQNLEERRQQLGAKLDEQLATLQNRLAKHPEEYDKIQKKIQALLASYGIPMEKSGKLMGEAFARGLRQATAEVRKSAKALADVVADYLRVRSPTKRGPMSDLDQWWARLAPTLTEGLDTRPVERASSRIAAAMQPGYGGYSTPAGGPAGYGPGSYTGAGGGPSLTIQILGPVYTDDRGVEDLTNKVAAAVQRKLNRGG